MAGLFSERVAFVTGAGGGIGAALTARLAAEGAAIAVTDIAPDAAERVANQVVEAGGIARPYRLDVTDADAVQNVVRQVETDLGVPTLAITCAGIIRTFPFLDLPAAVWNQTLNVNLTGTFLVFQAVARRMVRANLPGALVALASVAAHGGRANAADYAASKAGVASVVRSAALALAQYQITVNAICPGIVDTGMTRGIYRDQAKQAGITPDEAINGLASSIPLGRVQTTEDVVNVICFLLSPQGNYITGQAVYASGGLEIN